MYSCSYLATTLRQNNIEPMPSLADVRRVVTEHCILPLSKLIRLDQQKSSQVGTNNISKNILKVTEDKYSTQKQGYSLYSLCQLDHLLLSPSCHMCLLKYHVIYTILCFIRLSGSTRTSTAHQITDDNRAQRGGQEDAGSRHLY